jgi:hypothetical protein
MLNTWLIGGVRFLGLEGLTPVGIFPGGSKWAGSEFMPCIHTKNLTTFFGKLTSVDLFLTDVKKFGGGGLAPQAPPPKKKIRLWHGSKLNRNYGFITRTGSRNFGGNSISSGSVAPQIETDDVDAEAVNFSWWSFHISFIIRNF